MRRPAAWLSMCCVALVMAERLLLPECSDAQSSHEHAMKDAVHLE
jgi:hypothetical protein